MASDDSDEEFFDAEEAFTPKRCTKEPEEALKYVCGAEESISGSKSSLSVDDVTQALGSDLKIEQDGIRSKDREIEKLQNINNNYSHSTDFIVVNSEPSPAMPSASSAAIDMPSTSEVPAASAPPASASIDSVGSEPDHEMPNTPDYEGRRFTATFSDDGSIRLKKRASKGNAEPLLRLPAPNESMDSLEMDAKSADEILTEALEVEAIEAIRKKSVVENPHSETACIDIRTEAVKTTTGPVIHTAEPSSVETEPANLEVTPATTVPATDKTSGLSPEPIAPPRKKRSRSKKEDGSDANTDNGNIKKAPPPRPPPPTRPTRPPPPGPRKVIIKDAPHSYDPCIRVSTSTTEMNKILECGNSLEVVEDPLTKRSGGASMQESISSSPSTPPAIRSNLVRCNSLSGRELTDAEILEQVIVKNLDTGDTIPLNKAEELIPQCTDPLALHILKIQPIENQPAEEDGHISDSSSTISSISSTKHQNKKKKLKKFFGKTVDKIRSGIEEKRQKAEIESSSDEEEEAHQQSGFIKYKNHRSIKDRLEFSKIRLVQDLNNDPIGAIWSMKFSLCGKLLATAGQDNIVRVWVLKEASTNFEEMRLKYSRPSGRKSPTGSMTSSTSATSSAEDEPMVEDLHIAGKDDTDEGPFRKTPFVAYHGHTSDVLDLSWSKNYFLLSSSMDKTVRLWHISRQECLCCFQHVDFVTAICFHPRDDRYFLSGSLDGKIRLWNIPEKKVALWNEIDGSGTSLITAANFCQNGKMAAVGTYDGRCIFYDTERLKYHTQITVRSSRGKNSRGRKVSGIEPHPSEDKVLITSNDSRIRLYDLKDHSLHCKYKGHQNESSQIKASFSNDGKLILCGSEDKFVHVWRTNHKLGDTRNVRRDRNEFYECFSAHDAVVTSAIFAPFPKAIVEPVSDSLDLPLGATASNMPQDTVYAEEKVFEVLVTGDWQGNIKIFVNR